MRRFGRFRLDIFRAYPFGPLQISLAPCASSAVSGGVPENAVLRGREVKPLKDYV
jgi:hypothetical protein